MKTYRMTPAKAKSALTLHRKGSEPVPGISKYLSEQALNQMAASATSNRQFERALVILSELVERSPQEAKYYSNRGLVYLQGGQPWKALADFNQAIRLSSQLDQAFNNRANCHAALGNLQAAIADYVQAVDLNPFNVKARINLAITFREQEQYEKSLTALEEALVFNRLSGQIYAQLGRTYHLRGDWNAAIFNYKQALDGLRSDVRAEWQLRQQVTGWWQQLETGNGGITA